MKRTSGKTIEFRIKKYENMFKKEVGLYPKKYVKFYLNHIREKRPETLVYIAYHQSPIAHFVRKMFIMETGINLGNTIYKREKQVSKYFNT